MSARDKERLCLEQAEAGIGEFVRDAKPQEKSETKACRDILDKPCVRCRKPIGRSVFVRISGTLHPDGIYHYPGCVLI